MADTADLRSEGVDANSWNVRRYRRLAAAGLCVACETQPVKNRAYCYECSSLQSMRTYRSGLRRFFTELEIDAEETLFLLAQMQAKCETEKEHQLLEKFIHLTSETLQKPRGA